MTRRFSLPSADLTPENVFFNRRQFIKQSLGIGAGLTAGGLLSTCMASPAQAVDPIKIPFARPDVFPPKRNAAYVIPKEIGGPMTDRIVAGSHNNFYEFLPNRGGPVYQYVGDFSVDPWTVEITGLCNNPMKLDLDDLFAFEHEERHYHFRCVERWAMNVPWSGFPLSKLIEKADPDPKAKFVRFTTAKTKDMPGIRRAAYYKWPYREGLRMDEAMNELTMVVTGVYGKPLPVQHGAPIRIVVPWKYGYKNPKSIVKIEFLRREPQTFWREAQPHEYGFLSNVNPFIPHPRWSQERSMWLGQQDNWFETPIFNGYESYVAALYPDEPRTKQRALRPGQMAR